MTTPLHFAASVYDVLRQGGLSVSVTDSGREEARSRVLARLRFDDLFACEERAQADSARVVISVSDLVDGPLFSCLEPEDLAGLGLAICAHPRLVELQQSGQSPLAHLLRSWLQDEDGTGREASFTLIRDRSVRTRAATTISQMENLNVTSVAGALKVLSTTDIDVSDRARLEHHWWNLEEAFTRMSEGSAPVLKLTPRGTPASAVSELRAFKQGEHFQQLSEYSRTTFDRALALLEREDGRRDAAVNFMDAEEDRVDLTLLPDLDRVRGIFGHYFFRAIAMANNARDEHLARVDEHDKYGMAYDDFINMLAESDLLAPQVIPVPAVVVSTLGELPSKDFADIRSKHRNDLAVAMGLLRESMNPLEDIIGKLSRDIVKAGGEGRSGGVIRRVCMAGATGAVTAGATYLLTSEPIIAGAVGYIGAALVDMLPPVMNRGRERLLASSFVRRVVERTRPTTKNDDRR